MMKNSIIQSIHLVLASGGGCEVWHPEKCIFTPYVDERRPWTVEAVSDLQIYCSEGSIKDFDGWKIPRKPFSALVAEVQADPVNNAAVRALMGERADIRGNWVWVRVNEIDYVVIQEGPETIRMSANGFNVIVFHWYYSGLIREGYPCGIPRDHWISREEIK